MDLTYNHYMSIIGLVLRNIQDRVSDVQAETSSCIFFFRL